MVLRNCFLSELISAWRNSDMKLYAITMKLPHASVAQKLFVTKSSMEKSYLSSFILFSESAPPRYESSSHEQRRIFVWRRGDIAQKVCNEVGGVVFFSVEVWVGRAAGGEVDG